MCTLPVAESNILLMDFVHILATQMEKWILLGGLVCLAEL